MLSLQKLEIFNTVAIEGSFSKAARLLLLSQPAISQHVRDLEASLKVELFVRGSRGVTLTGAGETLLDYTRCILRLVGEAEQALMSLDEIRAGQIALGATPGASVYLLPEWVRNFHQRFPGLSILVRTDTTPKIAADLRAGKLDVGVIEGELDLGAGLTVLELQDIQLFIVVGPGHSWWNLEKVDIQALDGEPFIMRPAGSQTRTWTEQIMNRYGIRPDVIAEFDNPEAIIQAVTNGMGITILPEWGLTRWLQAGSLRILPLENIDMRRTLKLLYRSDIPLKPVDRAFISQLTEQYPHLAQMMPAAGRALVLPRSQYRASLNCKIEN